MEQLIEFVLYFLAFGGGAAIIIYFMPDSKPAKAENTYRPKKVAKNTFKS